MLRNDNVIASNELYDLSYDIAKKNISLIRKEDAYRCLTAKFFQDTSDYPSLLSQFSYLVEEHQGLTRVAADLASDYLSTGQKDSKLLCYPGPYLSEFIGSDNYKSSGISRLMVRENNTSDSETASPSNDIKITQLDAASKTSHDVDQIMGLLKQTYWAQDVNEIYVDRAIENSVCFVARNQENTIIGLTRYVTNGDFAYISDMIVDEKWRQQRIGTALMRELCAEIDKQYAFTILFSAREGVGQEAAPKLYGKKFGFKDYDTVPHQHEICFRYVKAAPSLTLQNSSIAGAAKTGLLLLSGNPSTTQDTRKQEQQPTSNVINSVKFN